MKKAVVTILAITVLVSLFIIFKSYTIETAAQKTLAIAIGTQEQAVATINELIAKNSAFSVQIISPELPIKVKVWQRKGLVTLPANIPWETFKKDIYQFGVGLHALLEKDARGAYYHIEELRKDPMVYNLLAHMNQKLLKEQKNGATESILKIEKIQTSGLLSRINLYVAALYQQKLLEKLKAFFKKFEERAKELRTQEEEAQKTAEQAVPGPSFDDFYYDYADSAAYTDYDRDRTDSKSYETDLDEYDSGDLAEIRDEEDAEKITEDIKEEDIDWGF